VFVFETVSVCPSKNLYLVIVSIIFYPLRSVTFVDLSVEITPGGEISSAN